MSRMRRVLVIAMACAAVGLSGCASHATNDTVDQARDNTLGKACDEVSETIPSDDVSRRHMSAYGASLARWAQDRNRTTRSAVTPIITSANAYASARSASGQSRPFLAQLRAAGEQVS